MSQNKNKKQEKDGFKAVLKDGKVEFASENYVLQDYDVTKACPTRQRKDK